ncbi:angiogenic factor with G patch and FHA domains 1 [Melanaphis sacchari]|uniref:angiogenic factor with G patch and FHA domains 1 n=1 Tax=Melanaphis sacchari TaxID=742174 RepID=UPI000DC14E2A|nr:angiogenic factor with G patch and FHA domains 1 [Melanaphis sacchari]
MDDVEVPFKDLLEHKYPEVYEYLKNAVRMLERQQNLLATLKNIKNNSSIDLKKSNIKTESIDQNIEIVKTTKKDKLEVKNQPNENADGILDNIEKLENVKKSENGEVDNPVKTESENKEEGECSEDEEKSKDPKQVNQYSLGESRFILEETTGMYYDQVTGYYYNLNNGLFYDGNQGCYYYFDVIAQKYRLYSQVHSDTVQLPSNTLNIQKKKHSQDIPGSISEASDSENSEDSSNLVIKEDTEEDTEANEKEIKDTIIKTIEKKPNECQEVKEELNIENKTIKDEKEEVKPEDCPCPPSTCEILDKRYLNLLQYTKLLPAPKNIVHKLTPDGSKAKQYAQIRNWYTIKHQLTAIESEIIQYDNLVWDRLEQYLCQNKRDDKNSNWKSYKEVKAHLSDTQTKLIKSKVVGWPPCIRIIITESKACNSLVGKLFLITCPGGTIGRSTNRDVIIPDDNVSKLHAEISFIGNVNKVGRGHYIVKDKGSTNGTFLDGKKLSKHSSSSEPRHLVHGSELTVGDTKLLCHIHDGMETCNLCEPGIQAPPLEESVKNVVPQKRKFDDELKSLKEKYGLLGCEPPDAVLPKGYKDRADKRRKTVGSQNANEKTEVACVTQPIPTKNKGFKLLENMGWTPGKSLGSSNSGIKEPISMDVRDEKMGLGFSTQFSQPEVPKPNILIKQSKIRFNFGNKTNMPIKTNRIHFTEDETSGEEK